MDSQKVLLKGMDKMRPLRSVLILVSLVLVLAACSNNKIEKSQQEVRQEKVEKAKNDIEKNRQSSSSKTEEGADSGEDIPNASEEILETEEDTTSEAYYASKIVNNAWSKNNHIIPEKIKNCIDKDHNVECFGSVHGHTDTLYCHTCGEIETAVNEETYPCEMEEVLAKEAKDQYEIKNTTDVPTSVLEQVAIEYSEGTGMTIGEYMQYMIDAINRSKKADKSDPYYQCPYCLHGIDCPDEHVGK